MLTLTDVATRLNVSVETVRRLIKNKHLKAVKVGNQLRVAEADLEEYIRKSYT